MPQIAKSLREPIKNHQQVAKEKGDLCFLITVEYIIPTWSEAPRWNTASAIRMALVHKPDMTLLRRIARGTPFPEDEVLNQAAMAYDEFYRRCVANYEDVKAKDNTDVYAGVLYSKKKEAI
jgi:hypothetical protein